MKVARLETLSCDAGWRPWLFLKATTDDGLVGWAEITDSHGSPRGLAGIVEDLAPLVVGRDPRAVERIYWDLYRHTRQSPGSVIAKQLLSSPLMVGSTERAQAGVAVTDFKPSVRWTGMPISATMTSPALSAPVSE